MTSEVVDLLRVRITWPIPKYNITEYRIEYCTVSSSCNTITVSADSNQLLQPSVGFVSYVLEHGASLNTSIDVTLSANNDNGAGSTGNGPVSIPVATYGEWACLFMLGADLLICPKCRCQDVNNKCLLKVICV